MIVKKKSKVTKALIAVSFLIGIIAIVTPVMAADSNRLLIMAKGDDLDLPGATNFILGKIEFGGGGELPSVQAVFHQKIYDESGEKVYAMKGMLKDGLLLQTDYYFYCPIFNVWFINVWWVMGEGLVKTTDSDIVVFFRNLLPITMPNTEGKYESAQILMFLSFTGEYCLEDPGTYPPGTYPPVFILPEGGWALAAVIWEVETPIGPMVLPVGPISYLTKSIEI
ncbi:MAG: hypothetical protein CEE43_04435 [Promethearchaeota archaeon Loki_b32]|nr:MAG: hypothetical protein CEE43_04435 [Candidatus Lokiarchaeota archaeon Loki_b32]